MDVDTAKPSADDMFDSETKRTDPGDPDYDKNMLKVQFIGESKPVLELKKKIQKISPLDCNVLILGETGTGKEVAARMLHELSIKGDNNRKFFAVHCGGIPCPFPGTT